MRSLVADAYASFAWAAVFAAFAKVGGASEGVQAAAGLIAIAVTIVIAEFLS